MEPLTSGPSPIETSASTALSRTGHEFPSAAEGSWGASLEAQRPDDGLARVGASQTQGAADVLTVDDLLDEPAVKRRRRG